MSSSRVSPDDILAVLDRGARDFLFPMLDNGYVYPAAARLSLFASVDNWAMVFETFGFSPRAGQPDLLVTTFGSQLAQTRSAADFVSEEAYCRHLDLYANVQQSFFHPIEDKDWLDPEHDEQIAEQASWLMLRGRQIPLPGRADYAAAGVELQEPLRPQVFEVIRALAFSHRDMVLATEAERRAHLRPELRQLLVLDDWHHPDVVDSRCLPSGTETFRQLAQVLSSGDPSCYRSGEPANTHWSNWPDGGTL